MSKIIKTTVYTFDELKPEAKEKARNWYRDGISEYPFLEEYMTEQAVQLLAENKIKGEPEVQYSLSYCQGDGAMFAGTFTWGKYTAVIKQSGHYSHFNSKTIDLYIQHEDSTETYATEKVADKFNELYIKICRELEKQGYNYIEQEQSDESVDENISANEYTFTESGKRFG